MKPSEAKKKLEEIEPAYNSLKELAHKQTQTIEQLKKDINDLIIRINQLQEELKGTNKELNKARVVIGAEYLKGVEL